MDLPNKRTRFSEEKLKAVQEMYKRNQSNPQANKNPHPQNYYMYPMPQMPPQWPYHYTPQVPAASTPTPAPKPASKSTEGLKNFITRAFSKCQSDEERDYMENQIKQIIQSTKDSGKFNLQD